MRGALHRQIQDYREPIPCSASNSGPREGLAAAARGAAVMAAKMRRMRTAGGTGEGEDAAQGQQVREQRLDARARGGAGPDDAR